MSDAWKNRIVDYGEEAPDQLLANPKNFRLHPKHQQDALAGVLREVGVVQNVIVNQRTGFLLDGHLRVSLALRDGHAAVPVTYVDLSESEEALVLATLDPISAMAGTDAAKLDDLLRDVSTGDAHVQQMLDDLATAAGIVPGLSEPGDGGDEFDTTPQDGPTRCQRGDLWALGRHRLLCGDSTNAEDVARLMGGEQINICVTSPPYASQREYDAESGFTPIHPDRYGAWFDAVQANIAAHLAADGSYFLNIKEHCEDGQRHLYVKDLTIAHVREWGWCFVDEFCWRDTKNGVPGGWNNRFKDAWEPVFHFSRQAQIKFYPLANGTKSDAVFEYSSKTKKTATGSGLLGVKATPMVNGLARPSNVLEIAAASTGDHSAAYPVELPAWFIRAFTAKDDAAYDPFGGSGTTLIAAEREDRRAYLMELSPRYCDVILRRWEAETGQVAQKVDA